MPRIRGGASTRVSSTERIWSLMNRPCRGQGQKVRGERDCSRSKGAPASYAGSRTQCHCMAPYRCHLSDHTTKRSRNSKSAAVVAKPTLLGHTQAAGAQKHQQGSKLSNSQTGGPAVTECTMVCEASNCLTLHQAQCSPASAY
jgi:hypothetical protein